MRGFHAQLDRQRAAGAAHNGHGARHERRAMRGARQPPPLGAGEELLWEVDDLQGQVDRPEDEG